MHCALAGGQRPVCPARADRAIHRAVTHDTGREAFRQVPRTGVIYVMNEAARQGYTADSTTWANLGQGAPETGPLPGGPPRHDAIAIAPTDLEYAPVGGLLELREAVAAFYNRVYRRGLPSQYTADNVAISGGGRSALTRIAASLGKVNLGHFLPDYTAYEELLDIFRLFSPIPILLEGAEGYAFPASALSREIQGRGLGAVLISNPNNPTGKHIAGDELQAWVDTCRSLECALIVDEFYSHYLYHPTFTMESAARYVTDVDRDPIVILDGLTKNWRYPGWRLSWTVGPRAVIDAVSSAGSFLDGGGSRPLQRAAVDLLQPEVYERENVALRTAFKTKRDIAIQALRNMGVGIEVEPAATFYVWGNLAHLPPSLRDGHAFFRKALENKVIVVPGEFFDVNPGHRRHHHSRFKGHIRFSFGPPQENVSAGLGRLSQMIRQS